jgi:hypothetical protein
MALSEVTNYMYGFVVQKSYSTVLAGDNLIVGSKEGKMCWFDLDLSTRPYKTLKYL